MHGDIPTDSVYHKRFDDTPPVRSGETLSPGDPTDSPVNARDKHYDTPRIRRAHRAPDRQVVASADSPARERKRSGTYPTSGRSASGRQNQSKPIQT